MALEGGGRFDLLPLQRDAPRADQPPQQQLVGLRRRGGGAPEERAQRGRRIAGNAPGPRVMHAPRLPNSLRRLTNVTLVTHVTHTRDSRDRSRES